MDDFHLGIIEVPLRSDPPPVLYIHKSAEMIQIGGSPTFEFEDQQTQDAIRKVGNSFWRFCGSKYLGLAIDEEKETMS
jgi:hypothetical protein